MTSIFDSDQFNQNLFFPRPDNSAPPDGTEDIFIKVEDNCKIHVRIHRSLVTKFSIIFFMATVKLWRIIMDWLNLF